MPSVTRLLGLLFATGFMICSWTFSLIMARSHTTAPMALLQAAMEEAKAELLKAQAYSMQCQRALTAAKKDRAAAMSQKV